jgi:hypothetical protein
LADYILFYTPSLANALGNSLYSADIPPASSDSFRPKTTPAFQGSRRAVSDGDLQAGPENGSPAPACKVIGFLLKFILKKCKT